MVCQRHSEPHLPFSASFSFSYLRLPVVPGYVTSTHHRELLSVLPDGDEMPPWPTKPSLHSQRETICSFSDTDLTTATSILIRAMPLLLTGLQPQRPLAVSLTPWVHTLLGGFGLALPCSPHVCKTRSFAYSQCHLLGEVFLPSLKPSTSSATFTLHLLFLFYFSP